MLGILEKIEEWIKGLLIGIMRNTLSPIMKRMLTVCMTVCQNTPIWTS